jgi:hypothetical protein
MELWLLLILLSLGLFTYITIQRSVADLTRTPVWLLWLVLMTPVLLWSAWMLVYGKNTPPPLILMVGPFFLCPLLYWLLIQWGRQVPKPPVNQEVREE